MYVVGMPADDANTAKYLKPLHGHLSKIVEQEQWCEQGLKFARVKFLLGYPGQEVEKTFRKTIHKIETTTCTKRARAYEHFGLYYKRINKGDQAERFFNMAINECKDTNYRCILAERGLAMQRGEQQLHNYYY